MINLIPIGTANRPANENNASKTAENVEETSRSKQLADDGRPARVERRRSGNRRSMSDDRRRLTKSARKPLPDRRATPDRRGRRAQEAPPKTRKSNQRKGKIIDERV